MTEIQNVKKMLELKTIAVVGLSKDPAKESHRVAMYLKEHGYKIVPVNPTADMVLEQICFPSLSKIPPEIASTIEVVDVFRPGEETLEILLQALQLRGAYGKVKGIWLQEGIKNQKTEKYAKQAKMLFVQNKCMKKEHQKWFGKKIRKTPAKRLSGKKKPKKKGYKTEKKAIKPEKTAKKR